MATSSPVLPLFFPQSGSFSGNKKGTHMNDTLFNIFMACDTIKATILENAQLKEENAQLRERIKAADAARDEGLRSAERYHEEMVKSLLSGELIVNRGGN